MSPKSPFFSRLDKETHRQLSSNAGKKGHSLGLSREWTPEEAREAAKRSWELRRKRKAEEMALKETANQTVQVNNTSEQHPTVSSS